MAGVRSFIKALQLNSNSYLLFIKYINVMDIEHVRSRFVKHFDGTTGAIYAAPGRINLIGEHTDYNGGFFFSRALDKGMIFRNKPNGTNKGKTYSLDL